MTRPPEPGQDPLAFDQFFPPENDGEATQAQGQYIAKMPAASPGSHPVRRANDETDAAGYVAPSAAAPAGPTGPPDARQLPPDPPRRRWPIGLIAPIAVIVLSLVALAAVWGMTRGAKSPVAATSTSPLASQPGAPSSTQPSPSQTPSGSATTGSPATDSPSASESSSPSSESSTADSLPAGVKECAQNVGASDSTSCGFALAVAGQVRAAGSPTGPFDVHAHSDATGKDYTLTCTPAGVTVCSGGRAAVVYVS